VTQVRVREVGPRDGLQAEAPVPPAGRVAFIKALATCGIADIEAVAFVSARAVPAMAGAAEVLAALPREPGVRYWALVANGRGAELALSSVVDGLSLIASASEAYSGKNVGMTIDQSVAEAGRVASLVGGRVPVDAVISCAFGSPFEGDLEPAAVARIGRRLLGAGVTSLTLADTTGMATPARVRAVLDETGVDVGLHFHDTRGTALVNAYAAIGYGVTRFDTAAGGLGGSPFVPGAGGNLATEDLVHLLDDLGVTTGIDLEKVLAAARQVAAMIGHPVPSRLAAAGPRGRRAEG
jgi:hydroxymethylglutaryl-CoA lyase